MTIKNVLNLAVKELKESDVSEPESSAVLLLADVLGKDRAYVYAHGELELENSQLTKFKKYIERRKGHEPVWYIIGKVEFFGREFMVTNDVLTPRPETELLVQEVLGEITNNKTQNTNKFQTPNDQITIIELGTGSGAIIISLVKEMKLKIENKKLKITATDISERALEVAKKNAKLQGVENDIEFLQGDLLEPIKNLKFKIKNSMIVANLPYIPHEDLESLQLDVLHHEPRIALDGGTGGLEIYERLLKQMKELGFTGMAFFEIGIDQGGLIKKIVHKYFPKAELEVKGDLAGIDRIVIFKN